MEEIRFKGIDLETGKEVYGFYLSGRHEYIITPTASFGMVWQRIKTGSTKQFIGETDSGGAYNIYDGDKLIANDGTIYTIQWCQWENGWRFYWSDGSQAREMGYPHEELREMELVRRKMK